MPEKIAISMRVADLAAIVFDFDGVLTDDKVYVNEEGTESVRCSRADGLGFDILRRTELKLYILSTETNPVVAMRAKKMHVRAIQGVQDKAAALRDLAAADGFELSRTLFVGNDVNDLPAMRLCGYCACPSDAHSRVSAEATFVLEKAGGDGVTRCIVEDVLGIEALAAWHGKSPQAAGNLK